MHSLVLTVTDNWLAYRKVFVLSCVTCQKDSKTEVDLMDIDVLSVDAEEHLKSILRERFSTFSDYHPGLEHILDRAGAS